jgi:hypothetical protein
MFILSFYHLNAELIILYPRAALRTCDYVRFVEVACAVTVVNEHVAYISMATIWGGCMWLA